MNCKIGVVIVSLIYFLMTPPNAVLNGLNLIAISLLTGKAGIFEGSGVRQVGYETGKVIRAGMVVEKKRNINKGFIGFRLNYLNNQTCFK